jgi:hypothetical protein
MIARIDRRPHAFHRTPSRHDDHKKKFSDFFILSILPLPTT